jgi:hypothetical protein
MANFYAMPPGGFHCALRAQELIARPLGFALFVCAHFEPFVLQHSNLKFLMI